MIALRVLVVIVLTLVATSARATEYYTIEYDDAEYETEDYRKLGNGEPTSSTCDNECVTDEGTAIEQMQALFDETFQYDDHAQCFEAGACPEEGEHQEPELSELYVEAAPAEASRQAYCPGTGNGTVTRIVRATVVDGYGARVPNMNIDVNMKTNCGWYADVNGYDGNVYTASGTTDAIGEVLITVTGNVYVPPQVMQVLYITIEVSPAQLLQQQRAALGPRVVNVKNTLNEGTLFVSPLPTATATNGFIGFEQGSGTAALFQSGLYDKPVVIPQGFDPGEQSGAKNIGAYWGQMNGDPTLVGGWPSTLLWRLREQGYDVWLAMPYKTGQSVHEQAAEVAQIVQMASNYGGGAKQVAMFGYSLGGLVTRLVSARWAYDDNWRSALGLHWQPPIRKIIMGDAPLRGAQANVPLQQLLWAAKAPGIRNLDSCAAQQMLQTSCAAGGVINHQICLPFHIKCWTIVSVGAPVCGSKNWERFYHLGLGQSFHQSNGSFVNCVGGPAVTSQGPGGDGWDPNMPRALLANSNPAVWNPCYKNDRDLTSAFGDGQYYFMCPDRPNPQGVYANTTFISASGGVKVFGLKILGANVNLMFQHVVTSPYFVNSDLEPGSRNDLSIKYSVGGDGQLGWGLNAGRFQVLKLEGQVRQYGSHTLIPARSALDANCIWCSYPSSSWTNTHSAAHERVTSLPGQNGQSAYQWVEAQLQ